MTLTPCENLRKSEVKKGDLVVRAKPSTKTISLTYFDGWGEYNENWKDCHFLAASETVEIILNRDNPVVNRWDKQVLPWVPYKCSHKYGGIGEVYFGTAEEVLETIRNLPLIHGSYELGNKILPNEGVAVRD